MLAVGAALGEDIPSTGELTRLSGSTIFYVPQDTAHLKGSLRDYARENGVDEPLNYIDVWSRMQIKEQLLEFQPTLLFVEHDDAFRRNIATKVIEL